MLRQPPLPAQPLPPAAFFILFALANGDKHGYAIMRESRELSGDTLSMGPATLYTTIQRLLDSGSIDVADGPAESDPRRRYYRLTRSGRAALTSELARMEALVRKAKTLRPHLSGGAS